MSASEDDYTEPEYSDAAKAMQDYMDELRLADTRAFSYRDNLAPDEIVPRLRLGSVRHAEDFDRLKAVGVTHVLNAAGGDVWTGEAFYGDAFNYLEVEASDSPEFDMSQHFAAAVEFAHTALSSSPENVLFVHCRAGVSRSATLVAVILMHEYGMTAQEALALTRQGRDRIGPNEGFLAYLGDYSAQLAAEGSVHPRPQLSAVYESGGETLEAWQSTLADPTYTTPILSVPVAAQIDTVSCGYHAFKNALALLKLARAYTDADRAVARAELTSAARVWEFRDGAVEFLRGASELAGKLRDGGASWELYMEELWSEAAFADGVLEGCHAKCLADCHPEVVALQWLGHKPITVLPELAYLELDVMSVERVGVIKSVIHTFVASSSWEHAFVLSGGPAHWITLLAVKREGVAEFIVADSMAGVKLAESIASDQVQVLVECLSGNLEYDSVYCEIQAAALIKECQGTLIKAMGCTRDASCDTDVVLKDLADGVCANIVSTAKKIARMRAGVSDKCAASIVELCTHALALEIHPDCAEAAAFTSPIAEAVTTSFMHADYYTSRIEGLSELTPESAPMSWDYVYKYTGECALVERASVYGAVPFGLRNHGLRRMCVLADVVDVSGLTWLDLSQNRLSELEPRTLSAIPQLRDLNLSNNCFTELPEDLLNCTALCTLSMASNGLTSLSGLERLGRLVYANFESNSLAELPGELSGLSCLTTLSVERNEITEVPESLVAGLTALRALMVSHNKLEGLPEGVAVGVGALELVVWHGNPGFE